MDQYGGTLTPDLRSGRITTNNVTVRITAGGGATLALSEAQVKELVAKVQQQLIEQAKRDRGHEKDPEGDDPPSGP